MRLFVEGCKYDKKLLDDVLGEYLARDALDGNGKFRYVGYLWSDKGKEAVFFLPKVIVYKPDWGGSEADGEDRGQGGSGFCGDDDEKRRGLVFGEIDPGELARDANAAVPLGMGRIRDFLLEFAIRIYRALVVFQENNADTAAVGLERSRQAVVGGTGVRETRLDVVLAILRFYRRNRDFVVFAAKRCHSGFNRVNWTKTVAKSRPVFQSADEPIYVRTENRGKRVDFEEELLVIFHSILRYVVQTWGFPVTVSLNYDLIPDAQFQRYMDGYGAVRLRAIKCRYFSDKLLALWKLCYLFFEAFGGATPTATPVEYVFAKKFDVVFEAMVDELIGEPDLPKDLRKLKEQRDGKRADHIFFAPSLIVGVNKPVCYVGDSKYYGIGCMVRDESIAKQFTYARNVIQWNIDRHQGGNGHDRFPMLRDEATESYDIVPNFFISAQVNVTGKAAENGAKYKDEGMRFSEDGFVARPWNAKLFSRQFENRLFDRDTLHIVHFDVNFLNVIALYGGKSEAAKKRWKGRVHVEIRDEIAKVLSARYYFRNLELREGKTDANAIRFIRHHFAELVGKVFSWVNADGGRQYILAVEKGGMETIPPCLNAFNCPFLVKDAKVSGT